MFNISKGRLSLNVFCSSTVILIKRALDDQSYPDIAQTIIQSETALAKAYLRHIKDDYPEFALMCYFDCKGYTVTKLTPKLMEDPLGHMSVSFW